MHLALIYDEISNNLDYYCQLIKGGWNPVNGMAGVQKSVESVQKLSKACKSCRSHDIIFIEAY